MLQKLNRALFPLREFWIEQINFLKDYKKVSASFDTFLDGEGRTWEEYLSSSKNIEDNQPICF